MDHGGLHESDGVIAKGEGVPLFHLDELVAFNVESKLAHEHKRLGSGNDLHLGPADQDFLDGRAVVGLHVVDEQVVQGPVAQQVVQILQQLAADGPVHGVEQDGGLVQQQIGIIAHTPGDGMDVFKQMGTVVVGPHPVQIISDTAHAVHRCSSFY